MRFTLSIALIICSTHLLGQLSPVQALYFAAGESNAGKSEFLRQAKLLSTETAYNKAYQGMAIAMSAEICDGIPDKISAFNTGKALIEKAVNEDFYNPEIRFLRFSLQAEIPMILGYRDNLKEDAWRIIGSLKVKQIDPKNPFWQKAISYLLNCDELDQQQKIELKSLNS
jgi:hypothetical protein